MRSLSRLIALASLLFVLAWLVYGRTLAVWYTQQTLAAEQSLVAAKAELAEREGHLTRLEGLTAEVADLELLVAGIGRQLPPRESRIVVWGRLMAFAKGYAVSGFKIDWREEAVDPQTQLGVLRVGISYTSSEAESLSLIDGLRAQRHLHQIERVDMMYDKAPEGDQRVQTSLEVGIYYDPAQVAEDIPLDLMGLVGAEVRQVEQAPPADQLLWQVRQLGGAQEGQSYEVTGNDRKGSPYVVRVASQEAPRVRQVQIGTAWYLVVETVEGEQVQQWLGE